MSAERRRPGALPVPPLNPPIVLRDGDPLPLNSRRSRFFDTNVLVYQFDRSDARKHAVAEALVRDALRTRQGCISWQVVQEWLNVVLRKAARPLSHADARSALDVVLLPLCTVMPSPELWHRAIDVQQRWGFGVYDSLIVASALRAGCDELLSEDLQHGQRIESMVVRNPFLA
jgi:predicted nucleic acid-binding protein